MNRNVLIKGNLIMAYADWQHLKERIGVVKLLNKVRSGDTFILKDHKKVSLPKKVKIYDDITFEWEIEDKPIDTYPVYSYERWICQVMRSFNPKYQRGNSYALNIRYTVGMYNDVKDKKIFREKDVDYPRKDVIVDSFIKINGIEVF